MGVAALGQHVARFAEDVLADEAHGLGQGLAEAVEAVLRGCLRRLQGDLFFLRSAFGEGVGKGDDAFFLFLLGRIVHGHHGDGPAGTGPGAVAAAQAFGRVDDAVLGVRRPGGADVEAEAILGTQAQVAHRHALHAEALPSIFSNFHAGTLQTGQSWGGSLPT